MCTRIKLFLAIALAVFSTNVMAANDIVHGVRVVVIDAGHGGSDPGACYGGVREKDLTLKVALKLGRMIEEEMPGVKVVYTRKTDKALAATKADDLQARADVANKAGGDLFLSVHANAAPRATGVRGVETLIMGESSKEQRYNENALYANNREDLIDMSDERTAAIVRAYIQNLQFTYGQYSMAFARCIQNSYLKADRHSRGVKPQLLRVLYATDMPSALTEIGFMTNAAELAYMKSEKGQTEIARSLLQAVKSYSKYLLTTRNSEEAAATPSDSVLPEEVEPTVKPAEQPADTASRATASDSKSKSEPVAAVRYTVQVIAATKAVPLSSSQFKKYRNKVREYSSEGVFRYKYGVGEYPDREAAQVRLREVQAVFPKAFVVRCKDGKIVK